MVFDLDGTLVDLGAHVKWNKVQQELIQLYLSYDIDVEKIRMVSNQGLIPMLENIWELSSSQRNNEQDMKIKLEAYNLVCSYETNACYNSRLMEGCLDTLEWLSKKKVRVGLCTSNSQRSAENVLKYHGIEHYFSSIIGRTTKLKMKPNPEQLIECFSQLGINPIKGVMVGDNHKDIIAGKAVGAYTIAIPVYFSKIERIKEAKADKIINNLYELPEILLSI
jgi:phosphoglycolate phosphatase